MTPWLCFSINEVACFRLLGYPSSDTKVSWKYCPPKLSDRSLSQAFSNATCHQWLTQIRDISPVPHNTKHSQGALGGSRFQVKATLFWQHTHYANAGRPRFVYPSIRACHVMLILGVGADSPREWIAVPRPWTQTSQHVPSSDGDRFQGNSPLEDMLLRDSRLGHYHAVASIHSAAISRREANESGRRETSESSRHPVGTNT